MKNKDFNNLHNSQFEQLLKKSLLENSNDKLNQKIIDINANYIFNKPTDINVNKNKVESLINKHLTGTKPNIFYYLKYILPVVLVISGYLLFNKFNNNNNKHNFIPVITENTNDIAINTDSINKIETRQAVLLSQKNVKKILLSQDNIYDEKDTIAKQRTIKIAALKSVTPSYSIDFKEEPKFASIFENYFYNKNGQFVIVGDYNNKYKFFPEKFLDMFKKFDNDKYILDREVTNGMWRSFLLDLLNTGQKQTALKCIPKSKLWSKYNKKYIYYFKEQKYNELPVVNISHEAAQIFNNWLTKKFNNYVLRKYGRVTFTLPTENEWIKVADGKEFVSSRYTWAGSYARANKGRKYGNYKISPYEGQNLVFSIDTGFKPNLSSNSYIFNKIPDSLRLPYYEDYVNGKISYKQFLNSDYKFLKARNVIYANTSMVTKNTYFNSYGVCNLMGNVSEMIEIPTKTKGGSWNTYANFMVKYRTEEWNGKPSPMVGFRPVMHIKSYISHEKVKGLKKKTPPGTILLNKNYGVDMFEITNVDYKEFLYYMKDIYGVSAKEYNKLLPDTNCWVDSNLFLLPSAMEPYKEKYFRHPAFNNYPVVGVSYEQAVRFCKWRSKVVTDNYNIYHLKHPKAKNIPIKVTYRLSTPDEWEAIAKENVYYVKSNEKLTKISKKTKNTGRTTHFGPTTVKSMSKNRIGVYGFDTNVSEMTLEKGVAKGGNWYQRDINQKKDLNYTKPESWLGFRCVVDIEY